MCEMLVLLFWSPLEHLFYLFFLFFVIIPTMIGPRFTEGVKSNLFSESHFIIIIIIFIIFIIISGLDKDLD